MTAAIYTRVSTADQKHTLQLQQLSEYAGRQGWTAKEFSDTASGAKSRRPGLDRLMEECRLKTVDIVLVWKMDRFARSTRDLLNNLALLDYYGVRFLSLTEHIDTDHKNPISKMLLTFLAGMAEFERDLIRERILAGVAAAQRDGKHCGRPFKVWRRDRARELRAAGWSWRRIAAELGVPVSSVRHACTTTIPAAGTAGTVKMQTGTHASGRAATKTL